MLPLHQSCGRPCSSARSRCSGSDRRRAGPALQCAQDMTGGNGARDTPVPIPNTEVKPRSADGTAPETVWESTSSPVYSIARARSALSAGRALRVFCGAGSPRVSLACRSRRLPRFSRRHGGGTERSSLVVGGHVPGRRRRRDTKADHESRQCQRRPALILTMQPDRPVQTPCSPCEIMAPEEDCAAQ